MAERYTRLFSLPETDLYETDAPLLLCTGALLKDTQTGRMIAQLKFRNIGTKPIVAVKVSLRAFDAFSTEVEGIPEFQYLDLSVTRDLEFGQKMPIVLPNAETRSFSCTCKSVIFADGSVWNAQTEDWKPLTKQQSLESRFGDLAAQYRRDMHHASAKYAVAEDRDLWLCACGAVNRAEDTVCHACKADREALKAAEDPERLKQHDEAYRRRLAEEAESARIEAERKAEEARIEAERKEEEERIVAKKRKKIAAIIAPIIVACIAFVIVLTKVIIPNQKYNAAVELYNAGKYEDAIEAFTALDGYKDSAEQITECKNAEAYVYAITAMEEGLYDNAITAFTMLDGYKDSAVQIEKCETAIKDEKYAAAIELYTAGKYEDAIAAFSALDGYKDSAAQIEKCEKLFKNENYAAAVELYNIGKYEEAIEVFSALNGYKDSAVQIEACEAAIKDEKYAEAMELYNAGQYEEAIAAFSALGGYKDSKDIVSSSKVWSVIGSMSSWYLDIPLYKVSSAVYETETMELKKGEEFKIRKNQDWTINYGSNGRDGYNWVVKKTGKYRIRFDENTGKMTLIPS